MADDPSRAKSDGRQSLTVEGFDSMMRGLARIAAAIDRGIDRREPA